MPVTEGQVAPDFALPDADGNAIRLSDFKGKHAVVLYFYPKDDTPGCTAEACAFGDRYAALREKDAVVLGVSPDDSASHRKFADKYKLPFPLLADTDHNVASLYDVWAEKSMYGKKYMGVERSTFLIDKDGVVRRIWRKVKVDGHDDEVSEALGAL